jgi:hypothetical protein
MRSHPKPRLLVALSVLTLALVGCASGGSSSGGTPKGSSTRIIESELMGLESQDAYTAIQRLRPQWLRSRSGSDPVVIVDGTQQQIGFSVLRTIRASELQELRYLSASDATTRYGTGFDGGAILLTTKR